MVEVSNCPHAQDIKFPTEVFAKGSYCPSAT